MKWTSGNAIKQNREKENGVREESWQKENTGMENRENREKRDKANEWEGINQNTVEAKLLKVLNGGKID